MTIRNKNSDNGDVVAFLADMRRSHHNQNHYHQIIYYYFNVNMFRNTVMRGMMTLKLEMLFIMHAHVLKSQIHFIRTQKNQETFK